MTNKRPLTSISLVRIKSVEGPRFSCKMFPERLSFLRSLSEKRFSATLTATRSNLLSYWTYLHTTTLILLSTFLLVETISLKIWKRPLFSHANFLPPVPVRGSKTKLPTPVLHITLYLCTAVMQETFFFKRGERPLISISFYLLIKKKIIWMCYCCHQSAHNWLLVDSNLVLKKK